MTPAHQGESGTRERPSDPVAAAIAIATEAHAGQVYPGLGLRPDEPFINHVLRVVGGVPTKMWADPADGESCKVVAALHDVVEDCPAIELPAWLTRMEYDACQFVTHDKGRQTYEEYIEDIATAAAFEGGHIARAVKIADLETNIEHAPAWFHKRGKYEAALARLRGTVVVPPLDAGSEKREPVAVSERHADSGLRCLVAHHTPDSDWRRPVLEQPCIRCVCGEWIRPDDWQQHIAASPVVPEPVAPLGGWQPIATAPKDGTEIVLLGSLNKNPAKVRSCVSRWSDREESPYYVPGWAFVAPGYIAAFQATHWMPLPAPPGSEP